MKAGEASPRKRRRVTGFRIKVALLLVAVCAFTVFRLTLRSKVKGRIEAIRAAGYPVTLAELEQWQALPDGAENAADAITSAFGHYVHVYDTVLPWGRTGLPSRTEPLPEETRAVFAKYVADNKEALQLLHAGAAMEHCCYAFDLSSGYKDLFLGLAHLRQGVQRLNIEAIWHAESDSGLCARSISSSFGLARSLNSGPVISCLLARVSCHGVTVFTLEHVLNRVDFTDEQLDQMSRAIDDARAPSAFLQSLVGQRCMTLEILRLPPAQMANVRSMTAAPSPKSRWHLHLKTLALALHRFAGLTDRSAITYLDLMEDYVEAAQLPRDERRRAIEAVDARCRAAMSGDPLLEDHMHALGLVHADDLGGINLLNVARAALAIQRYRLAAGRLPDSLADLAPAYLEAVPKNPFDGSELKYKKLDPGFILDMSADGGKETSSGSKTAGQSRKYNVTFIVER